MKITNTCGMDDFGKLPRRVAHAVKAIIFKDGKIGMIHHRKHDQYDLPGGGIENGETASEALVREVLEEAGAALIPSSIREFEQGNYILFYPSGSSEFIHERHIACYFCEIEDGHTKPQLTEHEINTGQHFVFVSIDEAIAANEPHMRHSRHWVENPTHVLNLLKDRELI
jgi:8-oxo-dGTP pyrophosphatase MutT (NUDIX family)